MRVLHLTTSFPKHGADPSGIFVYRLVDALGKIGTTCGVLTPADDQAQRLRNEAELLRFRYAPSKWQCLAQKPGGIPVALKANPLLNCLLPSFLLSLCVNLLKMSSTFDLIHAHWSICGALAVLTRRLHRKPVITTLRGSDVHRAESNGVYNRVHRVAVGGSSFTVGVSRRIVTQLAQQNPGLANRFRFVPNGVDERFYAVLPGSRPCLQQGVQLLFAGSLIKRKGIDLLLKALRSIAMSKTWTLTIVGDGPEMDRLVHLSDSLGIGEQISFLGAVSPDQMPSLMADHHVLVLPSRGEGRPNIILEAMAAALPVIATDIDGIGELVQNGRTGRLIPPNDHVLLGDALASVLNAPEELERYGLAGRTWMRDQGLRWEETAKGYNQLYHEAMAKSGAHWPVS